MLSRILPVNNLDFRKPPKMPLEFIETLLHGLHLKIFHEFHQKLPNTLVIPSEIPSEYPPQIVSELTARIPS